MKTKFENIIFYSGYFKISFFHYYFHVGVNIRTCKYFKHTYKSIINKKTKSEKLENSCKIEDIIDQKEIERINGIYQQSLLEELLIQTKGIPDYANVGDTVEISNKRAINYKNEQFVIDKIEHRFFKGRYTGTILHNKEKTIHTNLKNITVLEFNQDNINKMLFELKIGELKYKAI